MTQMVSVNIVLKDIELGDEIESKSAPSGYRTVRDIVYHTAAANEFTPSRETRKITVIFDTRSFCAYETSHLTVRRRA